MANIPNVDWAEKNLSRQLEWIGRIDVRVGLLITVQTGMLAGLFIISPKISEFNVFQAHMIVAAAALLLASSVFAYFTQHPNVKPAEAKRSVKSLF